MSIRDARGPGAKAPYHIVMNHPSVAAFLTATGLSDVDPEMRALLESDPPEHCTAEDFGSAIASLWTKFDIHDATEMRQALATISIQPKWGELREYAAAQGEDLDELVDAAAANLSPSPDRPLGRTPLDIEAAIAAELEFPPDAVTAV